MLRKIKLPAFERSKAIEAERKQAKIKEFDRWWANVDTRPQPSPAIPRSFNLRTFDRLSRNLTVVFGILKRVNIAL